MQSTIDINYAFFPGGKITIDHENGFISARQVFEALGLVSRQQMPKLRGFPSKTLSTKKKVDQQGNRAEDIVLVLKSLKLGSISDPQKAQAVRFLIEYLAMTVGTYQTEETQPTVLDAPQPEAKDDTKILIDWQDTIYCDTEPLTAEDLLRKDMSLSGHTGDDINAQIIRGGVQVYRQDGSLAANYQMTEKGIPNLRKLMKENKWLTIRQVCQMFPEKYVYDERIRFKRTDTIASLQANILIQKEVYDFPSPTPWVNDDLIILADNKRFQLERQKREAAKEKLIKEMMDGQKAEKPVSKRSSFWNQLSAQ